MDGYGHISKYVGDLVVDLGQKCALIEALRDALREAQSVIKEQEEKITILSADK